MPSMKRETTIKNFGEKLTALRRAAGLTQKQLGEKIGVSNRVIHYYETETNYPPAHLIDSLAKALKVSTDDLLGIKVLKQQHKNPEHAALWRRLKVLEGFSEKDKKAVIQYVEIIAKKNKAEQKATEKRQ